MLLFITSVVKFILLYVILILHVVKYKHKTKYDKIRQSRNGRRNFMIKIKLSDLLGKNKMTQKSLAELAHIRPATVSKMYYEETKRVDISQLNNICRVFNCEISDLLEYIPDRVDK